MRFWHRTKGSGGEIGQAQKRPSALRERHFLTTEYTEAVEPYLKNTEKISVYSVGERSDLSRVFCGKKGNERAADFGGERG